MWDIFPTKIAWGVNNSWERPGNDAVIAAMGISTRTMVAGVALGLALGILSPLTASAGNCAVQGPRELGEACLTDSDCSSAECKGLTCVKRTRPILKKGKICKMNQDCCSNKCTWFKCE